MSEHDAGDGQWERRIIEKLALEALTEQRRRRRWGVFFKLLGFAYLAAVTLHVMEWGGSAEGEGHTALVSVEGEIDASAQASAENIIAALHGAFDDKATRGVIVRINSPGGSPVQAGMINDEIRRLRGDRPDLPVLAVVEDICASGGYYIASAADRIYVDKASVVGSIGVLMDGFGFTSAMQKFGIERRLLTAGDNKGFLDSFSPQQPQQLEHAKEMLADIHRQFIDVVRQGRGLRLKETPDMFSGLMWTGARSIELGLADDFGTVQSVARDVIKAEEIRDFTPQPGLVERLSRQFGTEFAGGIGRSFSHFRLH